MGARVVFVWLRVLRPPGRIRRRPGSLVGVCSKRLMLLYRPGPPAGARARLSVCVLSSLCCSPPRSFVACYRPPRPLCGLGSGILKGKGRVSPCTPLCFHIRINHGDPFDFKSGILKGKALKQVSKGQRPLALGEPPEGPAKQSKLPFFCSGVLSRGEGGVL